MKLRLCLALLVAVAGCAAPAATPGATESTPTAAGPTPDATGTPPESDAEPQADRHHPESDAEPQADRHHPESDAEPRADRQDPPTDELGWEAGYWYDDPVDVDQSDGLNESERSAFVARTMARVERVRGLEFERSVPVELRSRDDYRDDAETPPASAWNEQVWEALFLVGEDRSVAETFAALYGGSTLGYYSPQSDRVVVVSDTETPTIDRQTLSHELVHALQDQHFGFPRATTRDGSLAADAVVEGDATYVEQLYETRCRDGWSCVPRPADDAPGGVGNMDVYVAVYQPYSDGASFVHALRRRGGWTAVNDAYARPPNGTTEVIHPETYPDATPANVSVVDRSNAAWSPFDRRPQADSVGEASLYAMLRATGRIDGSHLYSPTGPHRRLNYTHPLTTGWAGDVVVPYRSDDGHGYVFRSEWETERDAREFAGAYRAILGERFDAVRRSDADARGTDVYVVQAGPYADAFRVSRDGTTVTVVNAPTVDALDGVHRREG
ncbi:Hvo_1808 family surface protein [Salinirarus marinus]|uniref:Hvo_1808 family surface protein n=1 Tax=Salinirarus marinus TaxID=3068310 RepID=UPI003C6BED1E